MATATLIRLRYPANCGSCGASLPRGDQAQWDRETKTATCLGCLEPPAVVEVEIDRGKPGGSAAREWQRRHDRREAAVRARWGKLASLALALSDDPHATKAWAYGSNGEHTLGTSLTTLREEGMGVLHDRRIPGSRANIDHLVVAPWGVFVIDAKNYKGRIERRNRGGLFSTDYRLYVGGRDKTPLIAGLDKQVAAVRAALAQQHASVRICKTLCFVNADWSLFAQPIELGGAHILWPRALGKLTHSEGPLNRETIVQIERTLALALPAA
ncbi:MAG: nuclease-related domain-containing protein [Gaiellaceae bacterium]